jgi:hypothetical protein
MHTHRASSTAGNRGRVDVTREIAQKAGADPPARSITDSFEWLGEINPGRGRLQWQPRCKP